MEEFVDDRGKSCLYRLKEMCHDLFRNADEAGYKEKLYDITVGYIFHEAMKIREHLPARVLQATVDVPRDR